MPARSYGYLGDMGKRLQRLLGFDGEVGASFSPSAVPVILVGDATLPGYGDQQGRRFQVMQGVSGTGSYLYVRATEDVIIEKVRCVVNNAGAGTLTWSLVPPGTADPGSSILGTYLDRSVALGDRPPMTGVANATVTAGKQLLALPIRASQEGTILELAPVPFALAQGQALVFAPTATAVLIEMWGRTL